MALSEMNSLIFRRFCQMVAGVRISSTVFSVLRKQQHTRNYCTSSSKSRETDRDPLEHFLNDKNQKLMIAITDLRGEKYFRTKKVRRMREPEYKVLTDTEVQLEQEQFMRWAHSQLQMPPVMTPRPEINQTLSEDPDIADTLSSKFAFVDISINVKDRDRRIVIRDTEGKLRAANWEERDRLTQIYNPFPGRQIFPPKMFGEQELEELLPHQNYLYLLERASNQYEPDHPSYIRVTRRIFEHICTTEAFEQLRSTRYFGPMAFYFCWIKKIEPLLIDMINRDLLSHGQMLIQLYDNLHNISRKKEQQPLLLIKNFCETDASSKYKGQLELAITSYAAKFSREKMEQTS